MLFLKRNIATYICLLMGTCVCVVNVSAQVNNIQGIAPYYDSGVEQYRAALYVDLPQEKLTTAQALESSYAMAFRVQRSRLSHRTWIRDLSQRAAINNTSSDIQACTQALVELGRLLYSPFVKDDMIELKRAHGAVDLLVNGISLGRVEQEGFFELLLNAWVGYVPPSSSFKNALLASPVSSEQAQSFEYISELEDRQSRVSSWLMASSGDARNDTPSNDTPSNDTSNDNVASDVSQKSETVPAQQDSKSKTMKPTDNIEVVSQIIELPPKTAEESTTKSEQILVQGNDQLLSAAQIKQDQDTVSTSVSESDYETTSVNNKDDIELIIKQERLALLSSYRQLLHSHPTGFVNYPIRSQAKREEGVVGLLVTIDRTGEVLDVAIDASSSHVRLDRAAIAAVKKASPFPSLPEGIRGKKLEFVLPLAFRLQ